jgi:hypothetical protein
MKHNTKPKNYKTIGLSANYELEAIEKEKTPINREPATRRVLVRAAMLQSPNIFQLCKETSLYARKTHNRKRDTMPTTINMSLQKIAEHRPARKPLQAARARGVAA